MLNRMRSYLNKAEALRTLYNLAREHGAVGVDIAVDAVPAEKGGAR